MADESSTTAANLASYKLQLQQVEAALTSEADNDDLKKLRKDLQEVIELTEELLETQQSSGASEAPEGESSSLPTLNWKVGDRCTAPWSQDGQYYTATIDEVVGDGTCTVTFDSYSHTEVTQVALLKPVEDGDKATAGGSGEPAAKKTKRDLQKDQREYKKKKNEKKRLRQKQLEEEREAEKDKWINFNAKVFSKTSKGKVKKSIFASPDGDVMGKVGVGTCGTSGQPMTKFTLRDKWKKN